MLTQDAELIENVTYSQVLFHGNGSLTLQDDVISGPIINI